MRVTTHVAKRRMLNPCEVPVAMLPVPKRLPAISHFGLVAARQHFGELRPGAAVLLEAFQQDAVLFIGPRARLQRGVQVIVPALPALQRMPAAREKVEAHKGRQSAASVRRQAERGGNAASAARISASERNWKRIATHLLWVTTADGLSHLDPAGAPPAFHGDHNLVLLRCPESLTAASSKHMGAVA